MGVPPSPDRLRFQISDGLNGGVHSHSPSKFGHSQNHGPLASVSAPLYGGEVPHLSLGFGFIRPANLIRRCLRVGYVLDAEQRLKTRRPNELAIACELFGVLGEQRPGLLVVVVSIVGQQLEQGATVPLPFFLPPRATSSAAPHFVM